MQTCQPRYAIYWAPETGSSLDVFARSWLGRSNRSIKPGQWSPLDGLTQDQHKELIQDPFFYGCHATLKPPFHLKPSTDLLGLEKALSQFVQARPSFEITGFSPAIIGRFIALVPTVFCPELDRLAQDCVTTFDHFRQPELEEKMNQRRAKGLTSRQEDNLVTWGYPYVMGDYRFHITLTGSIEDDSARQDVFSRLKEYIPQHVLMPVNVCSVCLFVQTTPNTPFQIHTRYYFGQTP